jgi:hypothetical protein
MIFCMVLASGELLKNGRRFTTPGKVPVPSGRCEKIDFQLTSDLQSKKLRARIPSKRLLRLGCTFRIKNQTPIKSAKSIFSHLPGGTGTLSETPLAASPKSQSRLTNKSSRCSACDPHSFREFRDFQRPRNQRTRTGVLPKRLSVPGHALRCGPETSVTSPLR